ncbi:alpha/beta hydrolase-fold protein [Flammeovirga aprica]|uniref:Esterase n=1 Tax=Flammeovirga aprica JL-4 TaxID=694437 RepID=A0A7X9RZL5_9BACT|nr:alpha/beta hydrolase-fold protein [Flammeovirga aprica]NME71673.1 hypothetical protein [Flammeovirga aprica JL-4]
MIQKVINTLTIVLIPASLLKFKGLPFLYYDKYYLGWLIILTFISLISLFSKKNEENKPTLLNLIIFFIAVITTASINTENLFIIYSWYFIGGATLLLFLSTIRLTNQNIYYYLWAIFICSVLESIWGILQLFEILEPSSKYFAIGGSFKGPNHFGAFLGLGIISLLLIIKKINANSLKIALGLIGVFFFGFMYYVEARGAILSLIVGISTYIYQNTNKHKSFFLIGVFGASIILSIALLNTNSDSINGRLLIGKITLLESLKKPILGHGLHSFGTEFSKAKATYFSQERPWEEIRVASPVNVAYNDFMEMPFELGYVFTIIFVGLLLFILLKSPNNEENLLCKIVIIYLFIFSITNAVKYYPVFIIIDVIAFVRLAQECTFQYNIPFIKTSFLKFAYIPFTLLLTVLIIQRSRAEYYFQTKKNLNKKGTQNLETIIDYSTKINERGEHLYKVYSFLKKNNEKELAFEYITKTCERSHQSKYHNHLAKEYILKNNFAKANSIYNYIANATPYKFRYQSNYMNFNNKLHKSKATVITAQKIVDLPVKIASARVDNYKKQAKRVLKLNLQTLKDSLLSGDLSRELTYNSKLLHMRIPYKIYTPPVEHLTKKLPVVFVNDGNKYLKKGKLHQKIDSLIECGKIEPIIAVFIDPINLNRKHLKVRNQLFIKNRKFVSFFKTELMPHIEKKLPVSNIRKDRTIWGVSFGGLFASYIADEEPDLFKNIVMQSPAFNPYYELFDHYKSKPLQDFKMYLGYGTGKDTESQDLPFIKIMQEKGYEILIDRVDGANHDWKQWEPQLNDILIYYFGKRNDGQF